MPGTSQLSLSVADVPALEDRVLSRLKERLMAPHLVATFIDAFNAEMRRLATSAERESLAIKQTLAEVERKLAAIVRAIMDGGYNPTLKARLTALKQEKAQAEIRLRTSKPAPVARLYSCPSSIAARLSAWPRRSMRLTP
jgi:site-specific DNA recombinase